MSPLGLFGIDSRSLQARTGRVDAPFIGRAAQLAQLRAALAVAEQGTVVSVLLHGRSGMGKSALMQRFLGEIRAQAPERLVLFGRCFEQESLPYSRWMTKQGIADPERMTALHLGWV